MKTLSLSTLSAAVLLAAAPPAAADSFRCGSRLVTDGDTTAKVEALCGPPESITRREVLQRPVRVFRGRPYFVSDHVVAVTIEYWIYNLGPSKLMRRLRFEDGLLVDVDTLTHGYHPPDGD